MRLFITLGLLCLACVSCNVATNQTSHPSDSYLPLAVGNSWTLKSMNDVHGNKGTMTVSVIGDTVLNGKAYGVLEETSTSIPAPDYSFIRVDSLERIFISNDGVRETMFDTKKQNNETYTIDGFKVTVTTPDTLTTPAGIIRNCIDFYFDSPEMCDEESGTTFTKGIGFARFHGAWGKDYRLLSYTIK